MQHDENDKIARDRPADEGRRNDPDLRDESGAQPGVGTMSSSAYDETNERSSKSAADGFKTAFGKDADKTYDDGGSGEDGK
ncbi:hypothetical protein [Flaviaesturariibacter terrae]